VIVFSEIKRCQLPHSTQFFQKQKSAASQWLPFRQSPLREFFFEETKTHTTFSRCSFTAETVPQQGVRWFFAGTPVGSARIP